MTSIALFENLLKDNEFSTFNSYKQRIEYVFNNFESFDRFRDQVFKEADNYCLNHRKSVNSCHIHRCEGQYYLDRKEFNLAKQCLTNAILCAPFGSEAEPKQNQDLSSCYALRSLVFFELHLFENALFDINQSICLWESIETLFLKIHYLKVLNKFKQMYQLIDDCIERIDSKELVSKCLTKHDFLYMKKNWVLSEKGDEKEVLDEEPLKTTSDTNFWINSNIEMKCNDRKGRHFVAKDHIPEKTLIIREKPINIVNIGQNVYDFCSNCDKRVGQQFWPCLQCNEVVFCGKQCAEEAMNGFHKYECGINGLLADFGAISLHVFRIIVKIGCINAYNCELNVRDNGFDFNGYINDETQQRTPESEKSETQKLTQFMAITSLISHIDKHMAIDWICNTFTAIELTFLFIWTKAFDLDIHDFNGFVEFAQIVPIFLCRMRMNLFGWHSDDEDINRSNETNSLCLIGSLINHSCDPNTKWAFSDNYILFETNRDIDVDEEITVTYGVNDLNPLIERQNKLKTDYHFDCKCMACLKAVRTVRCLRCLACDGPVICGLESDDNCCLECDKQYKNMNETNEEVKRLEEQLRQLISDLKKNSLERDKSLESIGTNIKTTIGLVYKLSEDFLTQMRQVLRVCLQLNETKTAFELSLHLLPSIEYKADNCSTFFVDVFNDIFLLTQIYYKYFIDSEVVDKNQWQTCLQVYNKCIQLLKTTEDYKTRQQHSVQHLRDAIKQKKKELKQLKELFDKK